MTDEEQLKRDEEAYFEHQIDLGLGVGEALVRYEPVLTAEFTTVLRASEALWNSARVKYPDLPVWDLDAEESQETVVMVASYANSRQWTPLPVRTEAANDRPLQTLLCEMADTLLGPLGTASRSLGVPRAPIGWGSGRTQPTHTEAEVMIAARMGYGALRAQEQSADDGADYYGKFLHPSALSMDESNRYMKMAALVLTLAKIHQIDAIRVAVLEHQINPVFAGPIVADVCFGGGSRRI